MKRKSNGHVPNWSNIRRNVRERDKWCVICGEEGQDIHHVVYKHHGGKDTEDNLVLLCKSCHEAIHDNKPTTAMIRRGIHNEKQAQDYLLNYLNQI